MGSSPTLRDDDEGAVLGFLRLQPFTETKRLLSAGSPNQEVNRMGAKSTVDQGGTIGQAYRERATQSETWSGYSVKEYYTPEDVTPLSYQDDLNDPGGYRV